MAELPQNHSAREERTVSNLELYDTWAQVSESVHELLYKRLAVVNLHLTLVSSSMHLDHSLLDTDPRTH
jgi:hypothetical protein